MDQDAPSRLDLLLDLLSDEVAKRLDARSHITAEAQPNEPPPAVPTAPKIQPPVAPLVGPSAPPAPAPPQMSAEMPASRSTDNIPDLGSDNLPPATLQAPSHAAPMMLRLAFGILLIVILINIPFNAQGTAIARSIPNSAALVITDGLLVKETNSTDVYVYRDNAFHWITSLDAFEYYGYRWQDVHSVEAGFLGQFPKGAPVYVLLKCDASPHIYRLDAGQKRWIVDIPTFLSEGFVWQDVKFVSCPYLRSIPNGDSIPPGRGNPPPPLP